MLQQLAFAAVGGFGASFGRDLYRSIKKNPVVAFVVGALILAFGWRNLFLGVGHGPIYEIFVTGLGSVLMILVGAVVTALGSFYAASLFFRENPAAEVVIVVGCLIVVSLLGTWWGLRDRRARLWQMEVAFRNASFMEEEGLHDSGFDSDMIEDREGNRLKLIEQSADRMVFSVAGRRGLRAAIKLADGEMIEYTGVVRI